MSNKTIINGWSVSKGDFLTDYDYNELYKKAERRKKIIRNALIFTGSVGVTISALLTIFLQ
ncbi:MAG: hypothetical protein AB9882_01065 [Ignavibacteriaceae bacterium]